MKWTSVNEKLPPRDGEYMVTQEVYSLANNNRKLLGTEVDFADFFGGKWRRSDLVKVIAWAKFPKPYKKVKIKAKRKVKKMNKLKSKMKEKKVKAMQIAEALGISNTSMTSKIQKKTRFYWNEVVIISKLLDLTPDECFEVFADYV